MIIVLVAYGAGMPSLRHESLVELVRQHPPLAVDLARLTGALPIPDGVTATLGSEDMSDVTPPSGDSEPEPQKFTADVVVVVADKRTRKRLLALLIEPQGRASADKAVSWPCYVPNARRANRCPAAALIVLCWSVAEANKCRLPLPTGHPGYALVPLVIDRRDAPDLEAADPYLVLCFTVLNTVSLNSDKGRRRALDAIKAIRDSGARESDTEDLTRIIMGLASDASRKQLEDLSMAISYQSEFIDSWKDAGRAEGRAEGEARAKGNDILEALDVRGLKPTKKQRDKIISSTDLDQLARWFRQALTASTIDEVFQA